MGKRLMEQCAVSVARNCALLMRSGLMFVMSVPMPGGIVFLLALMKLMEYDIDLPPVPRLAPTNSTCSPVPDGVANRSVCWDYPPRNSLRETELAYVPGNSPVVKAIMETAMERLMKDSGPVYVDLRLRPVQSIKELQAVYDKPPYSQLFGALVFPDITPTATVVPEGPLQFQVWMNGSYLPPTRMRRGTEFECRPEVDSVGDPVNVTSRESYRLLPTGCRSQLYLTSGFLALQAAVRDVLMASKLNATWDGRTLPAALVPRKVSTVNTVTAQESSCPSGMHLEERFQQLPLPEFKNTYGDSAFRLFTAVYMGWTLLPMLISMVKILVSERDRGHKSSILASGLDPGIYQLAWLIAFGVVAALASFVVVLAAKVSFLFQHSEVLALLLLVAPFAASLVPLGFVIALLFKGRTAAILATAAMVFVGSLAIIFIHYSDASRPVVLLLSLFSPVAFSMSMDVAGQAEAAQVGVRLDNFASHHTGLDADENPHTLSAELACVFMILDAALYGALAYYLQTRSAARSFTLSKLWIAKEVKRRLAHRAGVAAELPAQEMAGPQDPSPITGDDEMERVNDDDIVEWEGQGAAESEVPPMLQLRSVCSELAGKEAVGLSACCGVRATSKERRTTVRDVTLSVHEGQVLALLGGSGSGKSTLLKMLAGVEPVHSGSVELWQQPLHAALAHMHGPTLSYCPQENISSNFLTPVEHSLTPVEQVAYFAAVKGCPDNSPPHEQARRLLEEVGMGEVMDKRISTLRAGEVRMLNVLLAVVGSPAILLLDEPSEGMDVGMQEALWAMLRRRKCSNQVTVLATSELRAVELLADTKAILSHGRLKCWGTSAQLKARFGLGYTLHLTARAPELPAAASSPAGPEVASEDPYVDDGEGGCARAAAASLPLLPSDHQDPSAATLALVKKYAPAARLKARMHSLGGSVPLTSLPVQNSDTQRPEACSAAFALPAAEGDGGNLRLGPMLEELWARRSELGVLDVALEATSLEEVLARMSSEAEAEATSLPGAHLGDVTLEMMDEHGDLSAGLLQDPGGGTQLDSSHDFSVLRFPFAGLSAGSPPAALWAGLRSGRSQLARMLRVRLSLLVRDWRLLFEVAFLPISVALFVLITHAAVDVAQGGHKHPWMLMHDPHLGHDAPFRYAASSSAVEGAAEVASLLGPNHRLVSTEVVNASQWLSAPASQSAASDAGSLSAEHTWTGPSVVFEEVDLRACTAAYTILHDSKDLHLAARLSGTVSNAVFRAMHAAKSGEAEHDDAGLAVSSFNAPLPFDDGEAVAVLLSMLLMVYFLLQASPLLAVHTLSEARGGLRHLLFLRRLAGGAYLASTVSVQAAACLAINTLVLVMGAVLQHGLFTGWAGLAAAGLMFFSIPALLLFANMQMSKPRANLSRTVLLYIVGGVVGFFVTMVMLGESSLLFPAVHLVMCLLCPPYTYIACTWFVHRTTLSFTVYGKEVPGLGAYFPSLDHPTVSCMLGFVLSPLLSAWVLVKRDAAARKRRHRSIVEWANPSPMEDEGTATPSVPAHPQESSSRAFEPMAVMANIRLKLTQHAAHRPGDDPEADPKELPYAIEFHGVSVTYPEKREGVRGKWTCGKGKADRADDRKVALSDLWLGVRPGEATALAGSSKAGKSTALQVLTGNVVYSGQAFLCNSPADAALERASDVLSYCPSDDVSWGHLTVRETMLLHASIRGLGEQPGWQSGVSPCTTDELVDSTLREVRLADCSHQLMNKISAADRRKTELAACLMGAAPVVLLDEPTRGLDIASKQQMWGFITTCVRAGSAVLLATNAMDEVEAVCNQVAILVAGELCTVGDIQALKEHYGSMYTIHLSCVPGVDPSEVHQFVNRLFKSEVSHGSSERAGEYTFQVPKLGLGMLREVFNSLEDPSSKKSVNLSGFSVSQPSLQQVLLGLAQSMDNHSKGTITNPLQV